MKYRISLCISAIILAYSGCSEYEMTVTSVCGNKLVEVGEQCDDGNTESGDGCSEQCQLEDGWYLYQNKPKQIICGNEFVEHGEQCDDGNTESGDGCSNCKYETGWYINDNQELVKAECGNHIVELDEICDLGSDNKDDATTSGCNTKCKLNHGWHMNADGIPTQPKCGNRYQEYEEQCDDGNEDINDGCSPLCTKTDIINVLNDDNPICGDGFVAKTEACDDGNSSDGDGCNSNCQIEDNFICISYKQDENESYLPVVIRDFRNPNDGNNTSDGTINDDLLISNKLDSETCSFHSGSHGKYLTEFSDYNCDIQIQMNHYLNDNEKPEIVNSYGCYSCPDSVNLWYQDNTLNVKYVHKLYNQYTSTNEEQLNTNDLKAFIYNSDNDTNTKRQMVYRLDNISFDHDIDWNIHDFQIFSYSSAHWNECNSLSNNERAKCVYRIQLINKLKNLFDTSQFYPLGALRFTNTLSPKMDDSKLTLNDFLSLKYDNGSELPSNNQFTLEAKGYFKFAPDPTTGVVTMKFNADDSIWVFINHKLALDFGGAHSVANEDVELILKAEIMPNHTHRYNQEFNLVEGGYYPIHIFFAERGGNSALTIDTPFIHSPSVCAPK